jgi:hypothetical protein
MKNSSFKQALVDKNEDEYGEDPEASTETPPWTRPTQS